MLRRALTLLAAASSFSFTVAACAQQAASAAGWQGEWGSYQERPDVPGYAGRSGGAIHIAGCEGASCRAAMETRIPGGNCGGSGTLRVLGDNEATLLITPTPGGSDHQCVVRLRQSGSGSARTIAATAESAECASYYCTSGMSFNGSFPLGSLAAFTGEDVEACFLPEVKPSRAAICRSEALASQEKALVRLAYEVHDLVDSKGEAQEPVRAALAACDREGDVSGCLGQRFAALSTELEGRRQSRIAELTDKGDPQAAAEAMRKIAGRYRHSFQNGDVQGNSFRSHDTLSIRPASATAITFDVGLEFFNGHTCSAAGTAEFRRAGAFVWTDAEAAPSCYLEIIPGAKGVQFVDPTGECKRASCGERGGWNGAEFLYRERISTAAAKPRAAASSKH